MIYIDDDEAMVFLVERMLGDLGYRVSGFTDADAGLAALRANADEFDLVVSDYNMPGLSGLDIAREVAQWCPGLPVLITSGHITEALKAGAAAAGVREVIYKPNTVDALCAAIHSTLASEKPRAGGD